MTVLFFPPHALKILMSNFFLYTNDQSANQSVIQSLWNIREYTVVRQKKPQYCCVVVIAFYRLTLNSVTTSNSLVSWLDMFTEQFGFVDRDDYN